jgi:hypothetical protein
MRICVATLTSQFLPVVLRRWFGLEIRRLLVAIAAWNRHVTSSQRKGGLAMSSKTKCGREKSLQIVAIFAAVEVWSGGKLPSMFVGVTIRAVAELHCIDRLFAMRNMALCALDGGMLSLQRIGGCRVFFQSEG